MITFSFFYNKISERRGICKIRSIDNNEESIDKTYQRRQLIKFHFVEFAPARQTIKLRLVFCPRLIAKSKNCFEV